LVPGVDGVDQVGDPVEGLGGVGAVGEVAVDPAESLQAFVPAAGADRLEPLGVQPGVERSVVLRRLPRGGRRARPRPRAPGVGGAGARGGGRGGGGGGGRARGRRPEGQDRERAGGTPAQTSPPTRAVSPAVTLTVCSFFDPLGTNTTRTRWLPEAIGRSSRG